MFFETPSLRRAAFSRKQLIKAPHPNFYISRGDGNGENHCLWVNGHSFLKIRSEDDWLSISIDATDNGGNLILRVENGELIVATNVKDFTYVGSTVNIASNNGEISLNMDLTNELVKINSGVFLDKYGDGFVVDSGTLISFIDWHPVGWYTGGTSRCNGFGDWGILNSNHFPIDQKPNGFGFFKTV